ncbi:unnamed protein product [Microthlaspi erraticum]|uniref:MULE transposase domain-containing protein n=1 Tax=Microthlaspi erraticum TaxID=1685480 RepID=A0A6D2IRP4_9BRAS|nr:unnamed protein product [Microthlaspi erraticum]
MGVDLRELHVVIEDDPGLAFISDRHFSIGKALAKVYPRASHGICIHHMLNNVISYFHGKGVVGLVEKASKAYRVVNFQKMMIDVCAISPEVGKYLLEADVRKWACCLFGGFRYDIRTTNPAESLNSALRSPREFPVIPLLDSIREMLTRWFYQRRALSLRHKHDVRDQVFPFPIPDSASAQVRSSKRVSNTRTRLHTTSYEFEIKLGQKYKLVECRESKACK